MGAGEGLADASIDLTIDAFDAWRTLAGVPASDRAVLDACTIVEARLEEVTRIQTAIAPHAEHRWRTRGRRRYHVTSYDESNVDEDVHQ